MTETTDAATGGILTETQGNHLYVITISRLMKQNALTSAMYTQLTEALELAARTPSVRAVLVRGDGKVFCAGNDLGDFRDHPPESRDSPVGRFLDTLVAFPKPLVAAVAGPALGIGTTMLLHCDLVYASPDARFQLPFTRLGLSPEAAMSVLLPMQVGFVRAAELLLLGEPFSATTALELGLINEVVELSQLEARAKERAQAILELAPAAVQTTKALIRQGRKALVEDAMDRESAQFFARLRSPEAREAFEAFFERRKPDFSSFDGG